MCYGDKVQILDYNRTILITITITISIDITITIIIVITITITVVITITIVITVHYSTAKPQVHKERLFIGRSTPGEI